MTKKKSPAIIWNGFVFRWKMAPHRLSLLGSRLSSALSGDQNQLNAQHDWHLKIGNWPRDRAEYNIPYTYVKSLVLSVGKGQSEKISLRSKIEQIAKAKRTIQVKVNDLKWTGRNQDISEKDQVKVLLNGFHIRSVNNHSGWHFGGLGIFLSDARWIDKQTLEFTAELFVRPARSPEPITHGNRKWKYKDDCVYEIFFDYAVVAGSEGNLHFTDTSIEHKDTEPLINFKSSEAITIKGEKNYSNAFAGLTGFSFLIDTHRRAIRKKRTGRYIREMGASIDDLAYDADSGKGKLHVNMVLSNKGGFIISMANKWTLQSKISVCLIQLNDNCIIRHNKIEGKTRRRQDIDRRFLDLDVG